MSIRTRIRRVARGFTLVELLIVMGIIGVIASVVVVAINPKKQLCDVRDADRRSSAHALDQALYQYLVENSVYPLALQSAPADTPVNICRPNPGDTSNCINLENALVPDYLIIIPTDVLSADPNASGYQITRQSGGRTTTTSIYLGTECSGSCGNAVVEVGEECDEGGDTSDCDGDCTLPGCGDDYFNDQMEDCDGGDGCGENCQIEYCGDGLANYDYYTGITDECDEGGDTPTCDGDCTLPGCGDDYVNSELDEECEPNVDSSCGVDCRWAVCGDGNPEGDEECDDENTIDGDGCSSSCIEEFCGDGDTNNNEECDEWGIDDPGCDDDCTGVVCGDGHQNEEAGEECDDENTNPGDGCDESCTVEYCGDGICNNYEDIFDCEEDCTECGDSYCTGDEDVYMCEEDCAECGDGVISLDEECDDYGTDPDDGCGESCIVEPGWTCINEPSECSED